MSAEALSLLVGVNRSRAVAAGMDVFLYDQLVDGVANFDDWRQRFDKAGRGFDATGREALEGGHSATAEAAFSTAALCFHYATCVPGGGREAIADLLTRAAQAHRSALDAAGRAVVRAGPDETDGLLTGLLEYPAGEDPVPLALVVPGLDSSKEEFDHIAARLRERGLATLRIDGPGQGEMLSHMPARADYEHVVAAAVDWGSQQPRIDAARIGAIGLSLGGFYVPRAIAFESRVRVAVAVTGPYQFPAWADVPEMLRDILSLRCGGEDPAADFVAGVDLTPVVARIGQPLLVVTGEADPVVPAEDGRRLAREARRGELLAVTGGDHLGANRRWVWEAQAADWLAARL